MEKVGWQAIANSGLWGGLATLVMVLPNPASTLAQPMTEEVPEEVLRTEIITAARSSLTGEPLSAAEYATLEEDLQTQQGLPEADPAVARLLLLIQLRQLAEPVFPFYSENNSFASSRSRLISRSPPLPSALTLLTLSYTPNASAQLGRGALIRSDSPALTFGSRGWGMRARRRCDLRKTSWERP